MSEVFQKIHERHEARIKRIKELRKQGFGFVGDYEVSDVVICCTNCDFQDDIEQFIMTRTDFGKKVIIPLTCPKCFSDKLKIIDERLKNNG